MTQVEMKQKVEELLANEEFVEKFNKCNNAEEMSELLAKENLDVTPDELRICKKLIEKKQEGELTDEDLENVSGGCVTLFVLTMYTIAACGVLTGLGALAGVGYGLYKGGEAIVNAVKKC